MLCLSGKEFNMWIWDQSAGTLYRERIDSATGREKRYFVAKGYSGRDWAKNNPKAENVRSMGPIPMGLWQIGAPYNSKNVGPYALTLEPVDVVNLHGRSAFRIHGDSVKNPGTASRGCIILPRGIRELIWSSKDHKLRVIE